MARALRRTLSAHIQEENLSSSGRGSVNSGFIMQIGGRGGRGGGVCAVSSSQRDLQGSHVSSLMSLSSGVAGGTGGLTGSSSTGNLLPNSSSILDGLFNLNKLAMIVPSSWLRIMARPSSMDRPGKSKGTLYRRPMMQLLLSFVLGLVLGFTPISWSGFTFARDDPRDDFAIEVNGFVTNLQREGSQSGEKLIELESEKSAVGLGHDGAGLNPDVDITDGMSGSKLDVSGANLLDIPPGLNFTKDPQRKLLIVVTPTYNRAFQVHFLTRLAHTLRLVSPPLLWLVVEAPGQSLETASLLRQTGIMYRHLVCNENLTNVKDRGIYQRNVALKHIEIHQLDGVVYFADDDNVYSLELFEQLRRIKRFGTWPVGMMAESKAKAVVEGPVCDGEKVIGWHTNEKSKRLRRFHVDMSGFGFNSTILWDTKHWRHRSSEPIRQLELKEGFQETTFIEQLVEDESQMEGLPSGCNKIMVWHLHLEAPGLTYPSGWSLPQPLESNIPFRS